MFSFLGGYIGLYDENQCLVLLELPISVPFSTHTSRVVSIDIILFENG